MALGKLKGKIGTNKFKFVMYEEAKKFEYIKINHQDHGPVLCQITEVERSREGMLGHGVVVGYRDKDNKIRLIRTPFATNSEVEIAERELIRKVIELGNEQGAYLGHVEGKNIKVFLNLEKLLTKHVAVLAKSGVGKSYTVGVLIEEILKKKVPLLIIDPHGEYATLQQPNDDAEDNKRMELFNVKPAHFAKEITLYGDHSLDHKTKQLQLNSVMSAKEIAHLLPAKLSNTQLGLLYSAEKNIENPSIKDIIKFLESDESNAKWTVINLLQTLDDKLFSNKPTNFHDLIKPGKCSIINLKGINPDLQQVIVYKLMKELFEGRKREEIPPFFTVIEEAHNFAPERSFGEAKSSKILRTVASEGRKFGLGLCAISQRPARLDKNIISQCTTQILLKVTNPNDLRAVSNSVEGITAETESELKNLPVGTALITGIIDHPLFVNVRPRMTKHGGKAVEMLTSITLFGNQEITQQTEKVAVIRPKYNVEELKKLSQKKIRNVRTQLIPAVLLQCEEDGKEFDLLAELVEGRIVLDANEFKVASLPDLKGLTAQELKILERCFVDGHATIPGIAQEFQMDIGEASRTIQKLSKKGFLLYTGSQYEVNEQVILSQLSDCQIFEKIEQLEIPFDQKLSRKYTAKDIKKKIDNYTNILDMQECFVMKREIKYV